MKIKKLITKIVLIFVALHLFFYNASDNFLQKKNCEPAAFEFDNSISTISPKMIDDLTLDSNFYEDSIDIKKTEEIIVSTAHNNSYEILNESSMSTAVNSADGGLLSSIYDDYSINNSISLLEIGDFNSTNIESEDNNKSIIDNNKFQFRLNRNLENDQSISILPYGSRSSDNLDKIRASNLEDDVGNDFDNSYRIYINSTRGFKINYGGDCDVFKFIPPMTGAYTFRSYGSTDVYAYLYNAQGNVIAANDNISKIDRNFSITGCTLIANQTYYMKVRHSSNTGTGEYVLHSEKIDNEGNNFYTANSITIGRDYKAAIDSRKDSDFFQFTPTITGQYSISTTGSVYTCGYLYDNNENLLSSNLSSNYDSESKNFNITYNLTANKTYYVNVNSYFEVIGDYTLNIRRTSEEGNDFSSAKIVSPGSNYKVAIDFTGDNDFYKFTPTITGQYSISTTGNTDTYGYLYNSNQSLLTSNDDNGGENFKITYNLTANKAYYIKVRHYSSTGLGDYTFNITRINEEGNDFSSAKIVSPGSNYKVAIDFTGDNDFYKFTPTITGQYSISTTGNTDTYGYLYNSNQSLLTSNDDNGGRNFKITYNLTANQTYYVKVKHYSSTGLGDYTFNITRINEEGNDFSSAKIISPGLNYKASIDFSGDNDFYKFTPTITGEYSISTTGSSDTYGYLYNANQALLTNNDDSGDRNFKITYNLTANQTYYVKVKHYSSTGLGDYTFNITRINEEGNDFSSAKVISPGFNYKASIDFSGDNDFYKITPTITGEYSISSTGNTDVYGYLYDDNKSLLASNNNYIAQNFKITYNLTANQTYYVKVNHYSSTGLGDYTFNITRINEEGNDFSSANSISLGRNYKAAIDFSGDNDFYKFIPTTTGAYYFYSQGEIDTIGYLYDNDKNLISKNDNDGSSLNFKIIKNLKANETYYLKVNNALTNGIGDYNVGVQPMGLTEIKTSKSEFTFIISGKDIESSTSTIRVTYDPNKIVVIDLCAMTSNIETELGKIDGTNLEIKSLKQGEIVFTITNTTDSDKTWTGVLNGIKFKNKTQNEVKVSYSIE